MKMQMDGKKRRSLKSQLFTAFLFVMVMMMVLVGLLQTYFMYSSQMDQVKQLLQSRLRNIEKIDLIQMDTPEKVVANTDLLMKQMIDLNVSLTLIGSDGSLILSSENKYRQLFEERLLRKDHSNQKVNLVPPELTPEVYRAFIEMPTQVERYEVYQNGQGDSYLLLLSKVGPLSNVSGLLQLSTPVNFIHEMILEQLKLFLVIVIMGLFIGGGVIILIIRSVLKPLNRLSHAMETVERVTLNPIVPDDAMQLELMTVSTAYNHMMLRLRTSFEAEEAVQQTLKDFVSDAAHELRTPLTAIKGFAEVLSASSLNDQDRLRRGLQTIESESDRLTRLVNKLLDLSKLDQKASYEKQGVTFIELLEGLKPQLAVMAGERQIVYSYYSEKAFYANSDQVIQVILNLFQNAIQFTTPSEGMIELEVHHETIQKQEWVSLSVKDNGVGIPKAHLRNVFNRFYRVEKHRSSKTGGNGLGLAIVKAIVEQHNGIVTIDSEPGQGTQVTVLFEVYSA